MTNELILGCALVNAFTHRFIKGFRVGLQMPCLLAVEGSKQPQVSALPERRVKKLRQTALTGYFRSSQGLHFSWVDAQRRQFVATYRDIKERST